MIYRLYWLCWLFLLFYNFYLMFIHFTYGFNGSTIAFTYSYFRSINHCFYRFFYWFDLFLQFIDLYTVYFFVDVTPNCVIDIIGSNTCFIVPTYFLWFTIVCKGCSESPLR